jgi:hypothetical protein
MANKRRTYHNPAHGPSSPTPGRSALWKRFGRLATPTLNDERDFGSRFLSVCTLGLPHLAGTFPEREGGSGTRSGVEADEEVAVGIRAFRSQKQRTDRQFGRTEYMVLAGRLLLFCYDFQSKRQRIAGYSNK